MTLPAGVTLGPGRRLSVSQRGYFVHFPDGSVHFTACRFASLAQTLERGGYRLPLSRQAPAAGAPDNFVHTLQLAGDNTPTTGSTIRQAQKALRVVFGADAPPVQFGTMADLEVHQALAKGATIGIGVDCGKLPAHLRRWVGQKYLGGHFLTFDAVRTNAAGQVEVADTDHMYAPAKAIHPVWVLWSELAPAVSRLGGDVRVTLMYDSAASPAEPETDAAKIARLEAEVSSLNAQVVQLNVANAALTEANTRQAERLDAIATIATTTGGT